MTFDDVSHFISFDKAAVVAVLCFYLSKLMGIFPLEKEGSAMWKIGMKAMADPVFQDGVGEQPQRSRGVFLLFVHFLSKLLSNENYFRREGSHFPVPLPKFMWMVV